jgi:hypothetical protein
VVIVIAVCVSFLAIVVFVLLVAFFKCVRARRRFSFVRAAELTVLSRRLGRGRSSRKVAIAAGRRTMGKGSPGAPRASASFVTPASAFALPPMRPPVAGDPFAAPAARAFAAPAALPSAGGAGMSRGPSFNRNNAVAPMPSPALTRVAETDA